MRGSAGEFPRHLQHVQSFGRATDSQLLYRRDGLNLIVSAAPENAMPQQRRSCFLCGRRRHLRSKHAETLRDQPALLLALMAAEQQRDCVVAVLAARCDVASCTNQYLHAAKVLAL